MVVLSHRRSPQVPPFREQVSSGWWLIGAVAMPFWLGFISIVGFFAVFGLPIGGPGSAPVEQQLVGWVFWSGLVIAAPFTMLACAVAAFADGMRTRQFLIVPATGLVTAYSLHALLLGVTSLAGANGIWRLVPPVALVIAITPFAVRRQYHWLTATKDQQFARPVAADKQETTDGPSNDQV